MFPQCGNVCGQTGNGTSSAANRCSDIGKALVVDLFCFVGEPTPRVSAVDRAVDFSASVETGGKVKAFYSGVPLDRRAVLSPCPLPPGPDARRQTEAGSRSMPPAGVAQAISPQGKAPGYDPYICTRARVAVYDAPGSPPEVEDVGPARAREYIEQLSQRIFYLSQGRGGRVPYTVIREVTENLLHAGFAEPVISILDQGSTIRFSDQGPGITDKERVVLPGFTTATSEMKNIIRGVGSGLPLVHDFLSVSGGSLSIEDNLAGGCVVTVRHGLSPETGAGGTGDADSAALLATPAARPNPSSSSSSAKRPVMEATQADRCVPLPSLFDPEPSHALRLSTRQKHVLALVLETGNAGPSIVSKELGVGLSTAYRDLASLEELGLISSSSGKRTATEKGSALIRSLMSSDSAT